MRIFPIRDIEFPAWHGAGRPPDGPLFLWCCFEKHGTSARRAVLRGITVPRGGHSRNASAPDNNRCAIFCSRVRNAAAFRSLRI